jgi:PIN domain nuclease of toxin-antitoxin system
MRILLDTHILVWVLFKPEKLPDAVRSLIEAGDSDVAFSPASVWEIAIKSQGGRRGLPATADEVWEESVAAGFTELPITSSAAAHVARLPLFHRDPFDRLLVAQAITEPAYLYTVDKQLPAYSELVIAI